MDSKDVEYFITKLVGQGEKLIKSFEKEVSKIFETDVSGMPIYKETSKQLLVTIDERFIKWISDVDDVKFDKRNHEYIFVRVVDENALSITGFNDIVLAATMTEVLKDNEYHIFDILHKKELAAVNKTVWE